MNISGLKNVYSSITFNVYDTNRETVSGTLDLLVYVWNHTFPDGGMIIPALTTEIGDECFRGIPASIVKMPDGLELIGQYAFADCPNLSAVYIPPTVAEIDPTAFSNARNDQLIIFGAADSPAEDFATGNGYWFVP